MGYSKKDTKPDNVDNKFGIEKGLVAKRRDELILAKLNALLAAEQNKTEIIPAQEQINETVTRLSNLASEQEHEPDESVTRLAHLTQSRPMVKHRKPSRHSHQPQSGSPLFFAENQEPKREENNPVTTISALDQLKKAITKAKERYGKLDEQGESDTPRHEPGWLTYWRHGTSGQEKAKSIQTEAEKQKNIDIIIIDLTLFFMDPQTRYNNNSFASYLLDELNDLLQHNSLPVCKPEGDAPYDKFTWIHMASQLKKIEAMQETTCTSTLGLS